jgi:hypothetical protein
MVRFSLLCALLLAAVTNGFVVKPATRYETGLAAVTKPRWIHTATAAAVVASASLVPLVAFAEEEDYTFGAVDAPIGLAVGLGVVAILTALLPVAMSKSSDF